MVFRWAAIVGLCAAMAASTALGIDEEARIRLEAAERRAAARSAAGGQSKQSAAAPSAPAVRRVLRLKPDAPEVVRRWFESLPARRAQEAAAADAQRASKVESLRGQAARLRAQAAEIKRRRVPMVQAGNSPLGPIYKTDTATAETWGRERKQLEDQAKALEAEAKQLASGNPAEPDETSMKVDALRLQVGEFGTVRSLRVVSVRSPRELIAMYGEMNVWVSGVDTTNIVDDQVVVPDTTFAVTGTRNEAIGKLWMIEPCDPLPYVELVTVDPSRALPPPSPSGTPARLTPRPDREPVVKGMTLAEVERAVGSKPVPRTRDGEGNSVYTLTTATAEGTKSYTLRFRDGTLTGFDIQFLTPPPAPTGVTPVAAE